MKPTTLIASMALGVAVAALVCGAYMLTHRPKPYVPPAAAPTGVCVQTGFAYAPDGSQTEVITAVDPAVLVNGVVSCPNGHYVAATVTR